MKLTRRGEESISIAFLDVITCGIGAIILLMMVARPVPPAAPDAAQTAAPLAQRLAELEAEHATLEATLAAGAARLAAAEARAAQLAGETRAAAAPADHAVTSREIARLEIAQQTLSDDMQRLLRARAPRNPALIGGVPMDSEYVVFLIDSSGSMFDYAWPKVMQQIIDTLAVYPHVKGVQVMNDQGSYMFPESRGQWLVDTPAQRAAIIDRLVGWNPYSASSPAQGIYTAINDFYSPDRRIGLYVYGDEFTGASISKVVQYVDQLNRRGADGRAQVRIHAIGFPTQFANPPHLQQTGIKFAALMRQLTHRNGGTFVGLNAFR